MSPTLLLPLIYWPVLLILPPKHISNKSTSPSLHLHWHNLARATHLAKEASDLLSQRLVKSSTWALFPPTCHIVAGDSQSRLTLFLSIYSKFTCLLSIPQIYQVHFYPRVFALVILSAWNTFSSNLISLVFS